MIHDLVVVELFDVEYYKLIGIPWRYLMMIKLEWLGYRTVKNYDDMLSRFHPMPERHGRTVGQTELLYQYRASVCWRAIKKDPVNYCPVSLTSQLCNVLESLMRDQIVRHLENNQIMEKLNMVSGKADPVLRI